MPDDQENDANLIVAEFVNFHWITLRLVRGFVGRWKRRQEIKLWDETEAAKQAPCRTYSPAEICDYSARRNSRSIEK